MAKMNMYDAIGLNGLNYDLYVVEEGECCVFRSEDRNVVVFVDMDYDGDVSDVFNGITEEPYNRLISFMNDNDDFIVYWSKVEGTTSDYTICCDCNYDDGWDIAKLREYMRGFSDSEYYYYKYTIIKDDKLSRF